MGLRRLLGSLAGTILAALDIASAASAELALQAYDLGDVNIQQAGVAAEAQELPVPITGIIGAPDQLSPVPLVLLLHGRHPGCHFRVSSANSVWPCPAEIETRYDEGMGYLAQALLAAGYGVLIPNLNGAYTNLYGVTEHNRNTLALQRSLKIVSIHLERLAAADPAFPLPVAGRLRLDQLVIIGHSLGGGAAVLLGQRLRPPPVGLLLLAPTPSLPIVTSPEAYRLPDLPVSILIGGCDRDVFDLSSLYYFETAPLNRTHRAGGVLILGANHNYFNAAVAADDYQRQPNNAAYCAPHSPSRLTRSQQERFATTYAQTFVAAVLNPTPKAHWRAIALSSEVTAPHTLFGVEVLTNLWMPGQVTWPIISGVPSTALNLQPCPAFMPCGRFLRLRPQFPAGLRVSWQTPEQLHFPISAPQDLSSYTSLQLRLATDSSDVLNQNGAPAFAVVLRDQQGSYARIEIPAQAAALRYLPSDSHYGYEAIPAYPSAIRIDMEQFRGIDLRAVTAIDLIFDATPQGTLELAEIAFLP